MKINRNQILASCLEVIHGISNKEYQERVWIRGEGPECDDFDETMCNFFQDGDGIINNYKDFNITSEQYEILLKFRNELDAFRQGPALKYYLPELFINTLEWIAITKRAKEVLKTFNYKNTN